jgi:molecular chaperone GrpE
MSQARPAPHDHTGIEPEAVTDSETGEAVAQDDGTEAEAARPEAEETDPLAVLRAELDETKDQLLRALAETENVRRRAAREREDASRYGIAEFAREVLTVSDNLERALQSLPPEACDGNEQLKSLRDGVEMTLRALGGVLERRGIQRIDPAGEPFDHNFHEAMFEIEDPSQAPGTVVQVVEPGYRIHDRLLRPARVGVAKGAPPAGVDTEV